MRYYTKLTMNYVLIITLCPNLLRLGSILLKFIFDLLNEIRILVSVKGDYSFAIYLTWACQFVKKWSKDKNVLLYSPQNWTVPGLIKYCCFRTKWLHTEKPLVSWNSGDGRRCSINYHVFDFNSIIWFAFCHCQPHTQKHTYVLWHKNFNSRQ